MLDYCCPKKNTLLWERQAWWEKVLLKVKNVIFRSTFNYFLTGEQHAPSHCYYGRKIIITEYSWNIFLNADYYVATDPWHNYCNKQNVNVKDDIHHATKEKSAKGHRENLGFKPKTSQILVRCSYHWAMKRLVVSFSCRLFTSLELCTMKDHKI